jgi:hypothetical protein
VFSTFFDSEHAASPVAENFLKERRKPKCLGVAYDLISIYYYLLKKRWQGWAAGVVHPAEETTETENTAGYPLIDRLFCHYLLFSVSQIL